MTNRIYLRVPSTKCEPSTPCNRYYFDDGTMVDLNADVRCGTCAKWVERSGEQGNCGALVIATWVDFACAEWEPRDSPCEWCNDTGYRASKPYAWYADKGDYVTTIYPCDCAKGLECAR